MKARKLLKDTGIGLCATLAFFGLSELALWALGEGDPRARLHLSRGFDATAAYIVPVPEVPGAWHTQFFEGKWRIRGSKERVIPPKSDKTRVLLFGGSNTQSFLPHSLEAALNSPEGEARYEVINLGREGYGSARVAVIFQQALEMLDPDVMVIYSGHNEFVERSFKMELESQWSSAWQERLANLALRTRTVNFAVDLFRQLPEPKNQPEAVRHEWGKFSETSYDQTLQYLGQYEENLRGMCRQALRSGVRVVLCTLVYNRFAAPMQSSLSPGMTEEAVAAFKRNEQRIRELLPAFLEPIRVEDHHDRVTGPMWFLQAETPKPREEIPPLPGRRKCFGVLGERDAMLPNPKGDWPPKVWRLYEALGTFFERDLDAEESSRLVEAELLLRECLELCPDHPRTYFDLGLVSYLLRRSDNVVTTCFERAGRYDRAPRKASQFSNQLVIGIAADLPDVVLFDVDELWARRMPMGLVGWEWMPDRCHLSKGAIMILMEDLARVILDSGR